jgi:hypothetical protein
MANPRQPTRSRLEQAVEAIDNLTAKELSDIFFSGKMTALAVHSEIELRPINQKSATFYRQFYGLRSAIVATLAENYRRYFKLALTHPHKVGHDPHEWALSQLRPAMDATLEWIPDWYALACDGEYRTTGPTDQPLETWRAPAWLFQISKALVGVGALKQKHVPSTDSDQKLSAAHTRLLVRGARYVFQSQFKVAIETVRNEEIAAAGAIPFPAESRGKKGPNKRKGWERKQKLLEAIRKTLMTNPGIEGLEFCAELDKRHAPPLYDWMIRGLWQPEFSWKVAWGNRDLRRRIRRVRQEALKTT